MILSPQFSENQHWVLLLPQTHPDLNCVVLSTQNIDVFQTCFRNSAIHVQDKEYNRLNINLFNIVSYCHRCYWSPRYYKRNGLKDRLMFQCLLGIWFWQIQTKMHFLLLLQTWITLQLHLEIQPSTVGNP